jgi:hypothetical protein
VKLLGVLSIGEAERIEVSRVAAQRMAARAERNSIDGLKMCMTASM